MPVGFELAQMRTLIGRFRILQEAGGVGRSCAYVLKNPRPPMPDDALVFARVCSMFLATNASK